MAGSDEPPALAYIEKTLADSYRKEIDQEENVWRSLPFFAATLALQLAALFQIIDKLPDPTTTIGWLTVVLIGLAGTLSLGSPCFLAASIYPRKFDYIAKEPALLSYAQELIQVEQDTSNEEQEDPFSALVTLKTEIARQYAQATAHNRQINKRRERWRSIAGIAALGSVLTTVFLVGAAYAHYVSEKGEKEIGHAGARSTVTQTLEGAAGHHPTGAAGEAQGSGAAPDANRH